MTSRLRELPEATLAALASALDGGRLGPPWSSAAHVVGGPAWVAHELRGLSDQGMTPGAIAWSLRMVVEERAAARVRWEGLELVWTGPDDVATGCRDTGAVARQLFATASRDLLVSTFALDAGDKAATLLGVLRDRMKEKPDLRVRFFVNFAREYGDDRPTATVLGERVRWFTQEVWPWEPRPAVYYDRRALEPGMGPRACLHAKCIVQDEVRTLITSANLTEAAQDRNIEAGVLVADEGFARKVAGQFERLVEKGMLVGTKDEGVDR